jgi:hypothetical protein
MSSLRELQRAMGKALLDASALSSAQAIYRNTCLSTLTGALASSFPAVRRLVGVEFFEGAAQEFIRIHPPSSAYLNEYGEPFAAFLAQLPQAAGLSYLADVARLEWAVNRALHAPDELPLPLASLTGLDPARVPALSFVPHPAIAMLHLDTPADAIWRAVLDQDQAAMQALDPAAGDVWLLIERSDAGVQVRRMTPDAWGFTQRLCAGEPLQAALHEAALHEARSGEQLNALLADHLAAGRFTHWRITEEMSR